MSKKKLTNLGESNKLIAEFMSLKEDDSFKEIDKERVLKGLHISSPMYIKDGTTTDLRYHFSWDWLIPVVEKIENLGVSFSIQGNWNEFHNRTSYNAVVKVEKGERISETCIADTKTLFKYYSNNHKTKIENTYQAVIEFIKWYNKQK